MKNFKAFLLLLSCFLGGAPLWAQYFVSKEAHQIMIFNHGIAALEQRLRMIERARHTIDVEYFIYDDTEISARLFSQALVKKAREGVRVRILVDGLSLILKVDEYLAAEFAKSGVTVKYFNQRHLLSPLGQHRNHRKHLIIDGADKDKPEVIMGGRNIEDKYFDLDPRYNFLDRDAWISGPLVNDIQKTFDQIWRDGLSKDVEQPLLPRLVPNAASSKGGLNHAQFESDKRRHQQRLDRARDFLSPNEKDLQTRKNLALWAQRQWSDVGVFSGPVSFVSDQSIGHFSWSWKKKNRLVWERLKLVLGDTRKTVLGESPYLILRDMGF